MKLSRISMHMHVTRGSLLVVIVVIVVVDAAVRELCRAFAAFSRP